MSAVLETDNPLMPARIYDALAAIELAPSPYLEDGHCRLVSRRRNSYKSFEVLRNALAGLRAQSSNLF